jgi:hypothetical protein
MEKGPIITDVEKAELIELLEGKRIVSVSIWGAILEFRLDDGTNVEIMSSDHPDEFPAVRVK